MALALWCSLQVTGLMCLWKDLPSSTPTIHLIPTPVTLASRTNHSLVHHCRGRNSRSCVDLGRLFGISP